jgi:hypothetical protein
LLDCGTYEAEIQLTSLGTRVPNRYKSLGSELPQRLERIARVQLRKVSRTYGRASVGRESDQNSITIVDS